MIISVTLILAMAMYKLPAEVLFALPFTAIADVVMIGMITRRI